MANLCTTCRLTFGSTSAFDAHRVGTHAYTLSEGLRLDPAREDGRRCLDATELVDAGWHKDKRGDWRQPISEQAQARLLDALGRKRPAVTRTESPGAAGAGRGGPGAVQLALGQRENA